MRALVLDDGVVLVRDHPTPAESALPRGEALVRVRRAGICNTDLELIKGYAGFTGVLGHEFVGLVEACPSDTRWVGRRVVGEINIACGTCPTCRSGLRTHCPSRSTLGVRGRDGAFADLLTLPLDNLHAVPTVLTDDQAVFVEPLAASLQILEQIHIKPSERVILLGDGKLGQMLAQVLALTGCELTVVGHHQGKLGVLSARGISTLLVDRSGGDPEMTADVVIEATGTPGGFAAAQRMVRPQGKLLLKSTYQGLARVDLSQIVVNEVQVIGSRCGPFEPALRLLALGMVTVEPLIQARYSLNQGVEALRHASARDALKVLLEM